MQILEWRRYEEHRKVRLFLFNIFVPLVMSNKPPSMFRLRAIEGMPTEEEDEDESSGQRTMQREFSTHKSLHLDSFACVSRPREEIRATRERTKEQLRQHDR